MKKRDKPRNLPRQTDERGMPIIRGAKEKEKKISKTNFHIGNGTEKRFLLDKWTKIMGIENARKRWKNLCSDLEKRYEKLIKKGVESKEAENKILEELRKYG